MTQLSASSSVEEVAAIVSDALTSAGITAVLSGGAAVQIYTSGLYESRDLDFVASGSQRELEQVLKRLGFTRQAGRHFVHDSCPYTLEFPTWPLAVGNELVREWGERRVGALRIQILTPTQCVMDRLAAFYHWRDRQGLDQAVLVAAQQVVDLDEIERWSATGEGGSVIPAETPSRPSAYARPSGLSELLRIRVSMVRLTRIGMRRSSPFGQLRCPDSLRESVRPWPPLPTS